MFQPWSWMCAGELSGLKFQLICGTSMDHPDGGEQTFDGSSVSDTSPNVGSASKRICFQSNLPFSLLVQRLKCLMAQPLMKGWLCSLGGTRRRGRWRRDCGGFLQHRENTSLCASRFHSAQMKMVVRTFPSCRILIRQSLWGELCCRFPHPSQDRLKGQFIPKHVALSTH